MDIVHSFICGHMNQGSIGSHMEIDGWEEAPMNDDLFAIIVNSINDHEKQLESSWSHG